MTFVIRHVVSEASACVTLLLKEVIIFGRIAASELAALDDEDRF